MAKAKVIVFDLFETLIHDIKFDFTSGLFYLYENILSKDTDKVEFLDYAATYWKDIYDKRNEDNSELPFEDELLDFKNKYGFKVDCPLEEIQYDLEKYFVNTYYSADYKVRKPHKDFFQIVFNEIKKHDNSIETEEVYFIGDNFEADVLGAESFGFTPLFINRKQIPGINNKNFIEINFLNEVLELVN